MLGSEHTVKFSKGTWHQIKIRDGKGPSRGVMSVVLARPNSRTDHMRRTWPKNDAPAKQRRIWRKISTSSRIRTKLRFMFLVKSKVYRHLLLQRDQKSENSQSIQEHRCTWWAKKGIKLRRIMDRKKVQNPNRSIDCKRWSAHSRGGTSVRSWLESVRNRATTRRNASCPIARQAVQRQRILLWVGQRSRATINPKWENITCKGLSVNSESSSSSTLRHHQNRWDQRHLWHLVTEL